MAAAAASFACCTTAVAAVTAAPLSSSVAAKSSVKSHAWLRLQPKALRGIPLSLSFPSLTRRKSHSPLTSPSVTRTPRPLSSPQALLSSELAAVLVDISNTHVPQIADIVAGHINSGLVLAEISPEDAKLAATILGPILAALNVLFILRIVMTWYPQLPVNEFPFNIVYTPTEPLLAPTRRAVPPIGGVDVAPIIWLAICSFLNEILLGQQGLLVLIAEQQIL